MHDIFNTIVQSVFRIDEEPEPMFSPDLVPEELPLDKTIEELQEV